MAYPILALYQDECLEMVKSVYGKHYFCLLVPRIGKLCSMRGLHGIPFQQALDASITVTKNTAEVILLLAAYEYIMNDSIKKYEEAVKFIDLYNKQLMHLDSNPHMSNSDKEEMRKHYRQKLNVLEQQRKKLLEDPDVHKAINVHFKEVTSNTK